MDRPDLLLADLRNTFQQKIPGGLTETADARLNRTLQHYLKQATPSVAPRDILRLTYDSMAGWFRRNQDQLAAVQTKVDVIEEKFESEVNSATLFASLKANKVLQQPVAFKSQDLETIAPVAVQPVAVQPVAVQQKDIITPQQDVVKYREVEYNLVMNSTDRDWLQNTQQNRYNFVIQFNTISKPQGTGYQPHVQQRLRNISRIEFVKAILPVEGLSVIIPRECSGATVTNPFSSVLGLPSINVLVDELQGNNVGTNNSIDNALAVCQYDATWRSEYAHSATQPLGRGYALFIPKFMKAQRIYTPAPLANLQTLSFRIEDPEHHLLSEVPDAALLGTIAFSSDVTGSCYSDTSGEYIFLNTKSWFSIWTFNQLDRIALKGLTFTSATQPAGSKALLDWLQGSAGHVIVGVAYGSSGLTVTDGANDAGYANWIIIRNRFVDPTSSGSNALNYFTGSSASDAEMAADLATYPASYQTGGMLNLSRQVQITLRIITRELDLVANVRADNV